MGLSMDPGSSENAVLFNGNNSVFLILASTTASILLLSSMGIAACCICRRKGHHGSKSWVSAENRHSESQRCLCRACCCSQRNVRVVPTEAHTDRSDPILLGAKVRIVCMCEEEYNGLIGTVVSELDEKGRYNVDVE